MKQRVSLEYHKLSLLVCGAPVCHLEVLLLDPFHVRLFYMTAPSLVLVLPEVILTWLVFAIVFRPYSSGE